MGAREDDGIAGWAHWLRRRLDTAFRRTEGWEKAPLFIRPSQL